jgi:hypothetical protein
MLCIRGREEPTGVLLTTAGRHSAAKGSRACCQFGMKASMVDSRHTYASLTQQRGASRTMQQYSIRCTTNGDCDSAWLNRIHVPIRSKNFNTNQNVSGFLPSKFRRCALQNYKKIWHKKLNKNQNVCDFEPLKFRRCARQN